MKAIVRHKYGPADVLRLETVDKPVVIPGGVLVKIHAAAVNPADWHIMRADPFMVRLMGFGVFKPKHRILGADIAGRVEAVGSGVTRFRPGDEVFGDLSAWGWGAFAEYACAPEGALAPKPVNTTFEQAAAIPLAAATALHGLRDHGKVRPGQQVLVNGASGGVGTFAVQIAKALGAEVTGVCSSSNVDMVRSIGADHVIDYTQQDVTRSGQRFDLILDAAAYRSVSAYKRVLVPGGTYLLVGGATAATFRVMLLGLGLRRRAGIFKFFVSKPDEKDLLDLKGMVEAGKITPVIDRRYDLPDVPDAIRYLETMRARGKVVIRIAGEGPPRL